MILLFCVIFYGHQHFHNLDSFTTAYSTSTTFAITIIIRSWSFIRISPSVDIHGEEHTVDMRMHLVIFINLHMLTHYKVHYLGTKPRTGANLLLYQYRAGSVYEMSVRGRYALPYTVQFGSVW